MSKTKPDDRAATGNQDRDLYFGLIRLHELHRATEKPIFGLGMGEKLGRYGYKNGTAIRSVLAAW